MQFPISFNDTAIGAYRNSSYTIGIHTTLNTAISRIKDGRNGLTEKTHHCHALALTDNTLREFSNEDPLHVYRYCRTCGKRATSPAKRTSIPPSEGAELCAQRGAGV